MGVICYSDVDMKRKAYCCDASRNLYQDYYSRQSAGDMPVFAGARIQRGHCLRSILGGSFRRLVLPFLKNNAKNVLTNAVKNVADDVLEGRSLKESAKRRLPEGIKRTVRNLNFQSGFGVRCVKTKNKKRKRRDVFS